MKQLDFRFTSEAATDVHELICGVVSSGNLEVLARLHSKSSECQFIVNTSVTGFDDVWQMVLREFSERYQVGGIRFELNDMGATPAVVILRLGQAVNLMGAKK